MERVSGTSHLRADGDWRALWKLKIPPKVKHFLWCLCKGALPTRHNLVQRHVEIEDECPWCRDSPETTTHLFLLCSKASTCWRSLGLQDYISDAAAVLDDFSSIFFQILATVTASEKIAWCMVLWSLWESKNDHVWENKHSDTSTIVWVGSKFFSEWGDSSF